MGQTKSEKVQYPNNQVVVNGCFGVVGDKLFNVLMCKYANGANALSEGKCANWSKWVYEICDGKISLLFFLR